MAERTLRQRFADFNKGISDFLDRVGNRFKSFIEKLDKLEKQYDEKQRQKHPILQRSKQTVKIVSAKNVDGKIQASFGQKVQEMPQEQSVSANVDQLVRAAFEQEAEAIPREQIDKSFDKVMTELNKGKKPSLDSTISQCARIADQQARQPAEPQTKTKNIIEY